MLSFIIAPSNPFYANRKECVERAVEKRWAVPHGRFLTFDWSEAGILHVQEIENMASERRRYVYRKYEVSTMLHGGYHVECVVTDCHTHSM